MQLGGQMHLRKTVARREFVLGILGQRDTDGVAEAIRQKRTNADG